MGAGLPKLRDAGGRTGWLRAVVGVRVTQQPTKSAQHLLAPQLGAGGETEDLHRPSSLDRDSAPWVDRRAMVDTTVTSLQGNGDANAVREPADRQALWKRPRSSQRSIDRAERPIPRRGRQRRGRHHGTEDLRIGRAMGVELEDLPTAVVEDAMTRSVQSVGVGLKSVAKGNARHGEALTGFADEPRKELTRVVREVAGERGHDRTDQQRARGEPRAREIRAPDRDASGGHVPTRVPHVQLGAHSSGRAKALVLLVPASSQGSQRTDPSPPGSTRLVSTGTAQTLLEACSHVIDDRGRELGGLDLGCTVHQPREVVGDDPVGDRGAEPGHDQVCSLVPAEVLEHQHA